MTVFYDIEQPSREEDKRAQQSPMESVTLILPLEATTMSNQSDSSGVTAGAITGATAGVTAAAAEQQRSDGGLITERYQNNTRMTAERQ